MRTALFLSLVLLFSACAEQTAPAEPNIVGVSYGEEVTLTERTEISDILANPEAFLGQLVLVQGTVVEVCTDMGCWMDITTDDESAKIQIKVEDGVIVFPVSARGKRALVQGVVEVFEQTSEEAMDHADHMAEESTDNAEQMTENNEVALDSTTVLESGKKTYRIRGIGAVIEDETSIDA